MAASPIQVGDRVVNLQVPGIFVVMDVDGPHVVLQSARGIRMRVLASSVRCVDESGVAPVDDG
jgi:hypothetical protein